VFKVYIIKIDGLRINKARVFRLIKD
jgi:hypothetical protein